MIVLGLVLTCGIVLFGMGMVIECAGTLVYSFYCSSDRGSPARRSLILRRLAGATYVNDTTVPIEMMVTGLLMFSCSFYAVGLVA